MLAVPAPTSRLLHLADYVYEKQTMPHLVFEWMWQCRRSVWFQKRTTRMEQSATEATGPKSAQFRSRVTTVVSQRRLNPSTSQTRELPNDSSGSDSSNERPFTSLVHESPSKHGLHTLLAVVSSIKRQKWLLHFIAVACTICFTYDLIYVKGSPFGSNTVQKSGLSPLNSMSQPFRLSRIANLHDPTKFEPFVISPLERNGTTVNVTACLCIRSEQLRDILEHVINWPGYLSVVVVHPEGMKTSAKRALKGELRELSRSSFLHQRLHLHLFGHPEHIPPPFNSLMNLGRFYAPTEVTILVPLLPLLPAISQLLASAEELGGELGRRSVVILGQGLPPSHSRESEASSSLLLRKSSGPWCPDRFISTQETQWRQCLWQAWLLSLGQFHFLSIESSLDAKELYKEASTLTQDHILERIDHLLIPKFRSETCIHVLRNLNALRQKEGAPVASASGAFPLQHQWLRSACAESLDAWGDAFV